MSLLKLYFIKILVVAVLSFFGINRYGSNFNYIKKDTSRTSSYSQISISPSFTPTPEPTPITGRAVKAELQILFNGLGKVQVKNSELIDQVYDEELESIDKYPTEDIVFVPFLGIKNSANTKLDVEVKGVVSTTDVETEVSFERDIMEPGATFRFYFQDVPIIGGEKITWYVNGEVLASYDVPVKQTPTPTPTSTPEPTPITGKDVISELKILDNGLWKWQVEKQELIDKVYAEELESINKYPTEDIVFIPFLGIKNSANTKLDVEVKGVVSTTDVETEVSFERDIMEPGATFRFYFQDVPIIGGEKITWYVNGEVLATYDVPVKPEPKAAKNAKEFSESTMDSFRKLEEGPIYLPMDDYGGGERVFLLEMADDSLIEEATIRYVSGSKELSNLFDIYHYRNDSYIEFNEYKGVGTATFEVFAKSKTGTASERLTVSVSKKPDLKPVKRLKTELIIKANEKIDLSSAGIISNPDHFSEVHSVYTKNSDGSYSGHSYHQMTATEPYELSSGQFVASEAGNYEMSVAVWPSINLVQRIKYDIIVTQSDDSGKTDSDNADVAVRGTCTTNKVNIRKKPSMNTGTVGQINKGDVVVVIGQQGEWSQIRSGTKEGYIKTQYIDFNGNGSYTNIKALWKDMDILIDGWKPKEGSFTVKLRDLNNGMKYDEAKFTYEDKSGKFCSVKASIINNQIIFTDIKDLDVSKSYDIELTAYNPDGIKIISNVGEHEMQYASFEYRASEVYDHRIFKRLYVSFESGILSTIAYEDEKFDYLCLKSDNLEMQMDNSKKIFVVHIYNSNGGTEKTLYSSNGDDLSPYAKYFDEAKTLKWKDGDFIIQ